MNPELVKFHLPITDQFSVAVDITMKASRCPRAAITIYLAHVTGLERKRHSAGRDQTRFHDVRR
jgi:hypothetical protein